MACVFRKKCCNRNERKFPFVPLNIVNFNVTIARNTVVVEINFKNLNFKNLTKMLLVLTMFIQRADNLAKLTETRRVLLFVNWEHKGVKCNIRLCSSSCVIFLCYQTFRCCSAFSVFMYENKRTITDSLALFY